MKTNPLKQGVLTENSAGIGTVTRQMVRERAAELAVINGRPAQEASKSDWEQAKRELTGESDLDRQEAVLDSIPEAKRGDPVPSATGHQVPETQEEEEDVDGRSESEQLAEKGVEDAERDQVLQAAVETAKKEKERNKFEPKEH